MKTKFKSSLWPVCHLSGGAVWAGAILLLSTSAQAQNLFGSEYNDGNIYEFTPGGGQSTFASGVVSTYGLAFNSAGDLFAANFSGFGPSIYEFAPDGTESTFASGLISITGLAFNNAGNLFAAEFGPGGNIYEFTPSGARKHFRLRVEFC